MAFGGVGTSTLRALKTEEILLKSKTWNESTFKNACQTLTEEFKIEKNSPGGKESYRTTLVLSFFKKFFDQSSECKQKKKQKTYSIDFFFILFSF